MPDVNILPNLGKIISLKKTIWGIKQKKIWHCSHKIIKHSAAAQANRWRLNYLCRI
jgi:hypothetical protein